MFEEECDKKNAKNARFGYEILKHDEIYERYKGNSLEVDVFSQMICA